MALSLGLVLAVVLLILFITKRISRRKLKLSGLNTKVRELELTAIRAQMNPHFMYNCLNSIQNLVQQKRSEEAHLYISKFASLIRSVLKYSDKNEISLAEELEVLKNYVDLEKLRFEISFTIKLDEQLDLYSVFIPPLLLQPIIENAILHGLATKKEDKQLTVEIKAMGAYICISIEDNGIGREAAMKSKNGNTGKGLQFIKDRLALMEQKQAIGYQLNITDLEDADGRAAGTRVEICIADE